MCSKIMVPIAYASDRRHHPTFGFRKNSNRRMPSKTPSRLFRDGPFLKKICGQDTEKAGTGRGIGVEPQHWPGVGTKKERAIEIALASRLCDHSKLKN